jgi:hypothetical protein
VGGGGNTQKKLIFLKTKNLYRVSLNVAAFLAAAPARLLRRGRRTAAPPSAPNAGQPSASVSINTKLMTANTKKPSPKKNFIWLFSFY